MCVRPLTLISSLLLAATCSELGKRNILNSNWLMFALALAVFVALTAIFGKLG